MVLWHSLDMNNYHAHIYFTVSQRETASQLVAKLLDLNLPELKLWKVHDKKVGPHALPMMEVHFKKKALPEVLRTLKSISHDLSILVHEDSGDDYKDHENPIWVGQPLKIDFGFFDKVKADASLSVH